MLANRWWSTLKFEAFHSLAALQRAKSLQPPRRLCSKNSHLELGGKNATILLDDAPLDEVMDGIVRASFTNSGQVCLCGSRILVHASIYDSFVERFVEAVEAIHVGDPMLEETGMGSVISLEHKTKVESYIDLGLDEGAILLTGGTSKVAPVDNVPTRGAFLRPTVLAGAITKFSDGDGGDFWPCCDRSSV